ncbi:hypothetical protein CP98_00368 [Sphingobium yanoikuyae]|uniref:Uncharacterized protein n=1 Tax=Sphingobium yanoikuyae TaxID=13690 RepID=A0A084EUP8_SPHYA|nr:hypothetical protein [Sphingobium yanoikuyae]KEZ21690.1 hypothetical protein CP98_00368 [Sphingobium yanoikuyae]
MKTYQIALMAACCGALISTGGSLAYWWLHRPAIVPDGQPVPVPAVASVVEQGPVEAVPAALAGAGWASQCSDYFAAYKFVDGWALEHNGRQTGRRHARYQKGDAGWKVILPGETQIYDLVDGRLHFRGWEIADQFIRPKQGSVMQRCVDIDFADVAQATDISRSVKEPLRFALWMAMNMNDAVAAEKIAARMSSVEGGINGEGDPDKSPYIDTMLSLTSRAVADVIQRKRGKLLTDDPAAPYAVDGQAWENVDVFPPAMQTLFGSALGCDAPIRFHPRARQINLPGLAPNTDQVKRIAVSGDRVLMEDEKGLTSIYEAQPDGGLLLVMILMKSGTPPPTFKPLRMARCLPSQSSAGDTPAAPAELMRNLNALARP